MGIKDKSTLALMIWQQSLLLFWIYGDLPQLSSAVGVHRSLSDAVDLSEGEGCGVDTTADSKATFVLTCESGRRRRERVRVLCNQRWIRVTCRGLTAKRLRT